MNIISTQKNSEKNSVKKFCLFSIKSTLLAISRQFQTPNHVRNTFIFCHSLSRYQWYMLTLQALTYTEDPECELAGPFGGTLRLVSPRSYIVTYTDVK